MPITQQRKLNQLKIEYFKGFLPLLEMGRTSRNLLSEALRFFECYALQVCVHARQRASDQKQLNATWLIFLSF